MAVKQTFADIDYVVKTRYSKRRIWDTASRAKPAFTMLPKTGNFDGKQLEHPIKIGNVQGIANSFPKAKANAGKHSGKRWALTRAKKYGYGEIDGETILATRRDEASFVREIRHSMDSLLEEWGNDAALELYGDGAGDIGKVNGAPAGNVITLLNPDDTFNFELEEVINGNTARTGAGTDHGTAKVTAVDPDAGKITVDAIGSIVDADFLFRDGNRDNGIKGFKAWIPDATPTSTLFFGVNRSVYGTRLGGQRVDGSGKDLVEAILELASKCWKAKGMPRWIFMNTTHFETLIHTAGSKVWRDEGGKATFGFESVNIATAAGIQKVIPDPNCPGTNIYMIDPRTVVLKHLGDLPHVVDDDGNTWMRLADDDGVEFRARAMWQLAFDAPGHNGTVHSL